MFAQCKYGALRLLTWLLLPTVGVLHGQSPCNYAENVHLYSVAYQDNIRIYKDPQNDYSLNEYSNVGWENGKEAPIEAPIAYVSGQNAKLRATFNVLCEVEADLFVKGVGIGDAVGYEIAPTPLTKIENPSTLANMTTDLTIMTPAFKEKKVDFWEKFEMEWYVADSNNLNKWVKVGTSTHPMYVTYQQYTTLSSPLYHTIIYYGCKNAKGDADPDQIIDDIYNNTFTDKKLKRKDKPNKPMSYWSGDNLDGDFDNSIVGLLLYEDGRCGAWEDLFRHMVLVHGIHTLKPIGVSYQPEDEVSFQKAMDEDLEAVFGKKWKKVIKKGGVGMASYPFFVKNWNFEGDAKFYLFDKEYAYVPHTMPETVLPPGTVPDILFGPATGAKAQNAEDPQSTFTEHALSRNESNGKIYDPSYGSPIFSNGVEWEHYSLDGVGYTGLKWEITINGKKENINLLWLRHNIKMHPSTFQITQF